jgi:hypothetical protein
MEQQPIPLTEQPRAEPEIIPPGAPVDFRLRARTSADTRARGRIYVARLGPVGSAVLFLAIGFLAVFALFLLLGAVLISLVVIRRFGAKHCKNFVDDQAASPSSWKTPRMAAWMAR